MGSSSSSSLFGKIPDSVSLLMDKLMDGVTMVISRYSGTNDRKYRIKEPARTHSAAVLATCSSNPWKNIYKISAKFFQQSYGGNTYLFVVFTSRSTARVILRRVVYRWRKPVHTAL